MKCAVFLQARMSSRRLPGKMLMQLGSIPLLEWMLRRCAFFGNGRLVALLTSEDASDDPLADLADSLDFPCFRGSLKNVRERYVKAAQFFDADVVCRVCGDSPFVDIEAANAMMDVVASGKAAYARPKEVPDGFVSETFNAAALKHSQFLDHSEYACEHVTPALRDNPQCFPQFYALPPEPLPPISISLTVDTKTDLERIRKIVAKGFEYTTPSFRCIPLLQTLPMRYGQ